MTKYSPGRPRTVQKDEPLDGSVTVSQFFNWVSPAAVSQVPTDPKQDPMMLFPGLHKPKDEAKDGT